MINGGYGRKMVVKELFGKVKIYRLHTRVDNRGSLAYVLMKALMISKLGRQEFTACPKKGLFLEYTTEMSVPQ